MTKKQGLKNPEKGVIINVIEKEIQIECLFD